MRRTVSRTSSQPVLLPALLALPAPRGNSAARVSTHTRPQGSCETPRNALRGVPSVTPSAPAASAIPAAASGKAASVAPPSPGKPFGPIGLPQPCVSMRLVGLPLPGSAARVPTCVVAPARSEAGAGTGSAEDAAEAGEAGMVVREDKAGNAETVGGAGDARDARGEVEAARHVGSRAPWATSQRQTAACPLPAWRAQMQRVNDALGRVLNGLLPKSKNILVLWITCILGFFFLNA